jgi:hypothetical protein
MPGKSKHGRGKHPHHKKSKFKQRLAAPTVPSAAVETPQPARRVVTPPVPRTPTSPVAPATTQYPYVTGELKRIGILAVIIVVVLIVLSRVLS